MLKEYSHLKLFNEVDKDYLQNLESSCKEISLPKNKYLFHEGDTGNGMYIIISGEIEIIVDEQAGNVVSVLTEGHPLGEISLLEKQTRIASARAKVDSKLLYLDITKFSDHIKKRDINALRIAYNIGLTMVDRLEKANQLITALQSKPESKRTQREVSKFKEKLLQEGLF